MEFVSPDSSRLQTRQWRKQWVTRRRFYLFWRFLTLSETKWWYSSSTRVFVFSWRVKSRRLAQLRSALAGEGGATESVIIWLLKTLLRNKFGVFETKRWLFRLIMMESNRILTKSVAIVIGWWCRGWRNGSVGFWRHSNPTYKLASRVTIETSCKFWGKMRCSRS